MNLIVRLTSGALAFWAATSLLDGITVNGGAWSYLWVALLFGLINGVIGSLVKLLTLPAILLSLGLFAFVVNAAMLMLKGLRSLENVLSASYAKIPAM